MSAMRPDHTSSQNGFALVTAIFLLVVLASLGAYLVSVATTQHQSSALDLQGDRAYQAARAGLEKGVYQVLRQGSCSSFNQVFGGSLAGFNVNIVCITSPAYSEGSATVTVYQITATATYGTLGSPDYVERQLQGTVAK